MHNPPRWTLPLAVKLSSTRGWSILAVSVSLVILPTACASGAGDPKEHLATTQQALISCSGQPAGTICRPAVSLCDVAERCDGVSSACPADSLAPAGTLCDGWSGARCAGTSASCPGGSTLPLGVAYYHEACANP
jgi:hypothetical protein